uniref:Uncharacterized protein n=1 Tax=Gloeothece verrucosa (strain PCC 7822) TaxID=497965 RepID=E0UMF6_GLOV7|nr:hypothetical protein Cyan7822_6345 [Gloeothece verrucosa PCC 7822]
MKISSPKMMNFTLLILKIEMQELSFNQVVDYVFDNRFKYKSTIKEILELEEGSYLRFSNIKQQIKFLLQQYLNWISYTCCDQKSL